MKLLVFLSIVFLSFSAFSQELFQDNVWPSFEYEDSKAVFTDFKTATYDISYDIKNEEVVVSAIIYFETFEQGYPVFDLVNEPEVLLVNGHEVDSLEVETPSRETTLRVIEDLLEPGLHELEVLVSIDTLIEFSDGNVSSAFWVTDLEDRMFLERYIPVSFEYDRASTIFNISFTELEKEQAVIANGKVEKIDKFNYSIEFPVHYTVNSIYFHTMPEGSFTKQGSVYESVDGRDIPVFVYTKTQERRMSTIESNTHDTLEELENDYGAFPHEKMIVYDADLSDWGLGGMEYAGATVTDLWALEHELFHSYFARAVTPYSGNAGWIDEALASWRDNGYPSRDSLGGSADMSSHPIYTRKTDRRAYRYGANFMARLNSYLDDNLVEVLSDWFFEQQENSFEPITTESFVNDIEALGGKPLGDLFEKHIYGQNMEEGFHIEGGGLGDFNGRSIHKKMDAKEMINLL